MTNAPMMISTQENDGDLEGRDWSKICERNVLNRGLRQRVSHENYPVEETWASLEDSVDEKDKTDETESQKETDEADREWRKIDVFEIIENYQLEEGAISEQFVGCVTPTDVFVSPLGDNIENVTYQSNLYTVQNNKTLKMTEGELLAFIGLHPFMGYHELPSWKMYWNTSENVNVPLVGKTIARNRFEQILTYLHVRNNQKIPSNNKDKAY
ncbi:hypothetical protein ILUMI_06249 [Ignelater luminosus]|uniref:PiggyBac transposable element-derived protein domain-containing protein n=1 Tax=Ignelater luminosus TaxID=2038154 RepID=A0A8K0GFK4_IGNLU|nr:hypothetical protein ILUMI_06249 [Ignelater luminosus]